MKRNDNADADCSILIDVASKLNALSYVLQGNGNPAGLDEMKDVNCGLGLILGGLSEEVKQVADNIENYQ